MFDSIIVGGGCAGLTAAIYLIRAGWRPVVYEAAVTGGQIAVSAEVENYPGFVKISGPELAGKIADQARELGVEIRYEPVTALEVREGENSVITPSGIEHGRTLILALGAVRRKLSCPGEDRLTGAGVSYCATCDGAFFKGKKVLVVGGGNTALEDALFLSNVASDVFLVHRRDRFTADRILTQAVTARSNIALLLDSEVTEILGETAVSAARIQNRITGETRQLDVSGVFIAVGLIPQNGIAEGQLPLDSRGYFDAGEDCATSTAGVFVAGDCRRKPLRQILTAASDGAVAGWAAAGWLNEH
ncbi:NAD(P)/FAD-dependent oxidoreductase [Feifania hominis]|uniref:FAD-dependent oxidoreductase n=1 Tax=Feifania hominis TaxID=2763660 RepID=A0A926DCX1_9FIRM|nr:FAD-dependent oxidoreductase [Feifania hominis]MBC8535891.1 FAD-dependent oxidoreductase [Feifania hominis]